MIQRSALWFAACLTCLSTVVGVTASTAFARENPVPKELKHVGVSEHLGNRIPPGLVFRDHTGRGVTTSSLLNGRKPVLFNLVYYTCPMLCSMVLDATMKAMKGIGWTVGKEYEVLVVSIDPKDTPERAAKKRGEMIQRYGRQGSTQGSGWNFWVGNEAEIASLANAVGFEYKYDVEQKQYAHPAVTMLLTPSGKTARYLYGIEIPPEDLKLGLFEASEGRFLKTIDKLILYCYHYNPQEGRYILMATRIMKIGGLLTVMVLGLVLGLLWRREWHKGSHRPRLTPKRVG